MRGRTLKIGISARVFYPEPKSVGIYTKTLQYLEESVAHWVMSRDVLVFMELSRTARALTVHLFAQC